MSHSDVDSGVSGQRSTAERIAYWLVLLLCAAPLISIAASQILLGAALVAVAVAHRTLKMPRGVTTPLLLFAAGTLLALAASPDPMLGLSQLKKFYVYLVLPVVYTALRKVADVRRVLIAWAVVASASGIWSFVQFFEKRERALSAGQDFYRSYVGERTTGFMSHWMTFGGEQMIVLAMLLGALLFGLLRERRALVWAACAVIAASIGLGLTRSVWLGAALGTVYLVASWKPKLLLLLPVLAPVGWFVAPASVRERAVSIYRPHGTTDSNQHRAITARTGIEMIKASPLTGLGPEIVGRDFGQYVPADVPKPLPEGFYGHLHNIYLQYAAERGIPTLLAFLWFIGAALAAMIRSVRRSPALAHGGIAVVAAVLAEGFFEFNLNDSEVLSLFLVAVAISLVGQKDSAADAPEVPREVAA